MISKIPENFSFYFAVAGDVSLLKIPKDKEKQVFIFQNVPRTKMADFYKKIDILINLVKHPGITLVTQEAMSSGRPVIMYDLGFESILDQSNGFLVKKDLVSLTIEF